MKKLCAIFTIVVLTSFVALSAWADSASKEECIQKCKDAAALIQKEGVDAGIKAIGDKNGPFIWKDTYVFLMDLEGNMVAHPVKPALTEKGPLLDKSDASGKKHFAEFIQIAKGSGEGWVDYMYTKPGMPEPKAKSSFIYRIAGTNYLVGAGIYN